MMEIKKKLLQVRQSRKNLFRRKTVQFRHRIKHANFWLVNTLHTSQTVNTRIRYANMTEVLRKHHPLVFFQSKRASVIMGFSLKKSRSCLRAKLKHFTSSV